MIKYDVYKEDTLEKLIKMVHKMNTRSIWFERLYSGQFKEWYELYSGYRLLCDTLTTIS